MFKLRRFNTILIVVLAIIMVLTLAVACDGNKTPEDNNPNDTTPPDPSKETITGVTFSDVTVTYDGAEHEITVVGTIPNGVTVNYTNNKGTDVGVYNATATLTGEGYNTLTLNAKLTIVGKDITGVTFSDVTLTYNGTEREITVAGSIPDGVTVNYTNNKGTDVGVYNATATLSGKGYNTLTLNAKLTIDKAEIATQLSFDNATVEYDALPHSIYVVGNVPVGVTVEYYYNDVKTDSVTAVGTYEVKAVLSGKNYVEKTLTAKLTIKSTQEMLYSAVFGGKVYFQNNLDGNKLYSATGSGNSLTKVSNDVASYFTSNGSTLYFYSSGLLSNTIKSLSGGSISSVFNSGRSTYLASDNSGNIYYAKANLVDLNKENGIYKVNATASNPTAVRLTTDKANYIAYYNGYIYYCNTSDGSKLYRIAVTANEGTGTKLVDSKVSDIIVEDGVVYYTQHETLNSSIWKYSTTSMTATKLCNDNGAYLTKVNDEIYYVNKDLVTSNIFGKGIYKVSINGTALNLVGEKVLDVEDGNGYYSLTSDGNNLFYYKANDKHFYRYNLTYNTETDLMRDFEPVEETTFSLYPYAHLATYKGEMYYTNPLDSNNLYKYNPVTKASYKVLTDSVSNVYFNGDEMYFSTYVVTNYALWKLDMTDPEAEPIKISSHRYDNLLFDGDDIYAIRVSAAMTYQNKIVKLTPPTADGETLYVETDLYNNRNLYISKLYLIDGVFHFTINPASTLLNPEYLYTHNLADSNTKQETIIRVNSDNFVIYNDKYYYHNHNKNTFCSTDMNTASENVITQNVEITDIFEYNGVIYYSSKSTQNTGIYAYDVSTGQTTRITNKVGHGFKVLDGKLYFINVSLTYTTDYPSENAGDGHLYSIDLTSKAVTKVA